MKPNSVIFITGAASGIGKWLSETLYRQGHRIVATDRNEAGLYALAQNAGWSEQQSLLLPLDVTDAQAWQACLQATLDKWQHLDIMMNVAGVCIPGLIYEQSLSDMHLQIDVNLKGTIYGTRFAADIMVAQGYGHIVNIASIAGIIPAWGFNLYNASKFGVRGFTLAAAYDLAERGVNVTVVCPDAVETPMVKGMETNPAAHNVFSGRRCLRVEEIGNAIIKQGLIRKKLQVVKTVGNRGILVHLGGLFPRLGLSWLARKTRAEGEKRRLARLSAQKA